jgi:hypothetical protein
MVVPKCSGKSRRDLPAAENRACHAVAVGRVLIGDEIALPGSVPDGVGADDQKYGSPPRITPSLTTITPLARPFTPSSIWT